MNRMTKNLIKLVSCLLIITFATAMAAGANTLIITKIVNNATHLFNERPDGKPSAGAYYRVWQVDDEIAKLHFSANADFENALKELNSLTPEQLDQRYKTSYKVGPTGQDGRVTLSGLPDGRYYIAEIDESGARSIYGIPLMVDLPYDGQTTLEVYPKSSEPTTPPPPPPPPPPEKPNKVVLIKLDEATKLTTLPGAVFNLYRDGEINPIQTGLVTDSKGEIVAQNLPPGDYYFQEIKAPEGYVLTDIKIPFTIKSGETVTVKAYNSKGDTGGEKFVKVAEKTGGKKLPGAKFVVGRLEKGSDGKNVFVPVKRDGYDYVVTSDENGYFEITGLPYDLEKGYSEYYLKETVFPEVDGEKYGDETGQLIKVVISKDSYGDQKLIEIINKKLPTPPKPPKPPTPNPPKPPTPPPTKPPIKVPSTGDIQLFLYIASGLALSGLGLYMHIKEDKDE